MLSPQHWCQVANDNHPLKNGTLCVTTADSVILQWNQRRNTRTIPLTPKTNIGVLRSAPGSTKYNALCAICEEGSTLAFPSTISEFPPATVSDDEEDAPPSFEPPQAPPPRNARLDELLQRLSAMRKGATPAPPPAASHETDPQNFKNDEIYKAVNVDFTLGGDQTTATSPEDNETPFDDLQLEWLRLHKKLTSHQKRYVAGTPRQTQSTSAMPCVS
jgi:hypothetical protein